MFSEEVDEQKMGNLLAKSVAVLEVDIIESAGIIDNCADDDEEEEMAVIVPPVSATTDPELNEMG